MVAQTLEIVSQTIELEIDAGSADKPKSLPEILKPILYRGNPSSLTIIYEREKNPCGEMNAAGERLYDESLPIFAVLDDKSRYTVYVECDEVARSLDMNSAKRKMEGYISPAGRLMKPVKASR